MSTIVLINDTSDQNNWGCVGTSEGLKMLLTETFPNVSILSVFLNTLRKRYRVLRLPLSSKMFVYESYSGNPNIQPSKLGKIAELICNSLSEPAEYFPAAAGDLDEKAKLWLGGAGGPVAGGYIELIANSDLVIFNGEGSIFGNERKGKTALFLLYLAKKYFHKPSCIVNHTAHVETSQAVMLGMIRRIYPLLDAVAVREPCSLRNLQGIDLQCSIELIPDALFSLSESLWSETSRPSSLSLDFSTGYACVGASSILAHTAPWIPLDFYIELVTQMKRRVPQVVLVAKDKTDWFLESVARRTNSIYFGPEHSYKDFVKLLEGARFFITGRYHHIIFSAIAGCPFIPLTANTHKIKGICELLQWDNVRLYDLTDPGLYMEAILRTGEDILTNHSTLSVKLKSRAAELARESRKVGTSVSINTC